MGGKQSSKMYDGFEIRFFEDTSTVTGCLYKDNKPIGFKTKSGEIISMHTDTNKTTIIKKLRGAINLFNSGKAEVVEVERLEASKFTKGDILVEQETNIVTLEDVYYILDSGTPYGRTYRVLTFETAPDDETIIIEKSIEKTQLDSRYISIGIYTSVAKMYDEIHVHRDAIIKLTNDIGFEVEDKLKMLNKTNDDFYNDLVKQISGANVSEYEKSKYLEFVSAAYNNSKKD